MEPVGRNGSSAGWGDKIAPAQSINKITPIPSLCKFHDCACCKFVEFLGFCQHLTAHLGWGNLQLQPAFIPFHSKQQRTAHPDALHGSD